MSQTLQHLSILSNTSIIHSFYKFTHYVSITQVNNDWFVLVYYFNFVNSSFRFEELPKVVYNLSSLEILLANDNRIQHIDPDGVRGLSRLSSLNLQNNEIMQVPPELGLCTQLRYQSEELCDDCSVNLKSYNCPLFLLMWSHFVYMLISSCSFVQWHN